MKVTVSPTAYKSPDGGPVITTVGATLATVTLSAFAALVNVPSSSTRSTVMA